MSTSNYPTRRPSIRCCVVSVARTPDRTRAAVSVVIVNYRSPELVMRCVRSIRDAAPELDLQIIVVDNGSQDGSPERLRAELPGTTVLACAENRGFAAGANTGMRASEAELVVLLNPDTEVCPGALSALVEHLRERPRTGVAAPLLENDDGSLQVSGYRRFPGPFTLFVELCVPIGYALVRAPRLHPYAMSPAAIVAGERAAHVSGAALAIRRSAYEQAGPLDEGFFLYLEETEWQRRLGCAGWAIEFVPHARVRHLVRGGGQAALAPSRHFVASALRYMRLQGMNSLLARLTLSLALALSWVTLRTIAVLPSKRAHARLQARAYRSLFIQALVGGRERRSDA